MAPLQSHHYAEDFQLDVVQVNICVCILCLLVLFTIHFDLIVMPEVDVQTFVLTQEIFVAL